MTTSRNFPSFTHQKQANKTFSQSHFPRITLFHYQRHCCFSLLHFPRRHWQENKNFSTRPSTISVRTAAGSASDVTDGHPTTVTLSLRHHCPAPLPAIVGETLSPLSVVGWIFRASHPSRSIQLIFITPFKSISRKFSIVDGTFLFLFSPLSVGQAGKWKSCNMVDETARLVSACFYMQLTRHFSPEMHFMLGNVQFRKVFFLAERWGFHWTGNERGRWL